jgi:hypothetical protein
MVGMGDLSASNNFALGPGSFVPQLHHDAAGDACVCFCKPGDYTRFFEFSVFFPASGRLLLAHYHKWLDLSTAIRTVFNLVASCNFSLTYDQDKVYPYDRCTLLLIRRTIDLPGLFELLQV